MKIEINGAAVRSVLSSPFTESRKRRVDGKLVVEKKFSAAKTMRSIKKTIQSILIVAGLSFGIFFIEEGVQMITYGNFQLADINDTQQLEKNLADMKRMARIGSCVNRVAGWVNPFTWIGYREFFDVATQDYIESMELVASYKEENYQQLASTGETPSTNVSEFMPAPNVSAISITDAHKWIGWKKTVLVPVSSVDKREKVAFLKTPSPFKLVIFPSSPLYEKATSFYAQWLVVQGEIKEYKGAPEIILSSQSQIIQQAPLIKEIADGR